jgi:hypothetical protein
MRPEIPTPQKTAQWIVEAHAENIAWEMTDREHEEYLGGMRRRAAHGSRQIQLSRSPMP